VDHWWSDDCKGEPKYTEKNLSLCHVVHYRSYMDWPGDEAGLCDEGRLLSSLAMAGL